MKFSAALLLSLTAFANENEVSARLLGANRVIERFRLVGSDAGRCATFDAPTGCLQDINVVADKFQDGTVKGTYQNVQFPQGIGRGYHGSINCLNIVQAGNDLIGIVSGILSYGAGEFVPGAPKEGYTITTAAKINSAGEPFYTFGFFNTDNPTDSSLNCTNPDVEDFFVEIKDFDFAFWKQMKGKVTIEVLN